MALSAAQVWEVRTTGSDSNGGAFKAGASGTDYSQQDAAQVTYTDLVIDATTNTKLTSAAFPFSSTHVGNVINITSGTGFSTGRYEVVSVTASVATMDRAVGTTSSTSGNGCLGGALLTLGTLSNVMVASNKAWVKSGTYGLTTALTFAQSVTPTFSTPPSRLLGYATTRGDITPTSANQSSRPLLQSNATLTPLITLSGNGWTMKNFQLGLGTGTIGRGVLTTGQLAVINNVKVSGAGTGTNPGIFLFNTNGVAIHCEVTAIVANGIGIQADQNPNQVIGCYVHDSTASSVTGILSKGSIIGCVVANLTGATSDGIQTNPAAIILGNTIYNCSRHGINVSDMQYGITVIRGNILANNGGYGLVCTAGSGSPASAEWDGNAFYSNTSGSRSNLDDVSGVNGSGPHTNLFDVMLSASPFTNPGSADYRLNSTVGGGAACRGTAPLNTLPGLATTGYRDFGSIQHQDNGVTTITTFIEG